MKNLPSIKQLQYLVALGEHRHFGKAAEACSVTQSTLSVGIRELEEILQANVAERNNRNVLLTPLGEQLVTMARNVILSTEDMLDLARGSEEPLSGRLRLGVIPTIGPYLLPAALKQVHKAYPKLELYLREDYTDRLLERLAEGQLDVLLLALPYEMDGVASEVLFEDRFVLACPKGHSLAARALVDTGSFMEEPLLLLEEGHCLRQHSLEACQLESRRQGRKFEATSMTTLVQMVSMGLGLTLLPAIAADAGIARGLDISLVPLDPGAGSRHIGLVWRATSSRGAEYRLLGDILKLSRPRMAKRR